MKDFDENKEPAYNQYFSANHLYEWSMSQPLSVRGFKWEKNKSKFTSDFILNYDVYSDIVIFYSTDDALLRKAFTDILNCCDIHFIYTLFHMANLLNRCRMYF